MDITRLKTVANFAREYGFTSVYIYKLIGSGRLKSIKIDGVSFIDLDQVPDDFKKKS